MCAHERVRGAVMRDFISLKIVAYVNLCVRATSREFLCLEVWRLMEDSNTSAIFLDFNREMVLRVCWFLILSVFLKFINNSAPKT